VAGANGTFADTGEVYPSNEALTLSVGFENVGNLNTGKANTLSLKPYSVPLQLVPILKDGSEGSPVWTADVTGGPTTVQPYEIAHTTVSWNETDCHGNAVRNLSSPARHVGSLFSCAGGDQDDARVGLVDPDLAA
jgi:hypothetical protein